MSRRGYSGAWDLIAVVRKFHGRLRAGALTKPYPAGPAQPYSRRILAVGPRGRPLRGACSRPRVPSIRRDIKPTRLRQMQIEKTSLPGVLVLVPKRIGDARGFFSKAGIAGHYRPPG